MPKLSPTALKARIDHLQKQLAAIETKKAPAIKKVQGLMKKLGVTIGDLKGLASPAALRGSSVSKSVTVQKKYKGAKSSARRGKVPVKFRDDKGNTWTGRGKTPRWLAEAEKAGKSRDAFRI